MYVDNNNISFKEIHVLVKRLIIVCIGSVSYECVVKILLYDIT